MSGRVSCFKAGDPGAAEIVNVLVKGEIRD